mgnify:FL=1
MFAGVDTLHRPVLSVDGMSLRRTVGSSVDKTAEKGRSRNVERLIARLFKPSQGRLGFSQEIIPRDE